MADMNAEPTTMANALAPWQERLKERGLDPADAPEPELTETPAEKAARQQARADTLAARWQELVPVMYQAATLADLDDTQHAPAIQGWLSSGSLNLVLAGAVGTGKTHAAYAVGNRALERRMWVEAWTVSDLMDALRPGSSVKDADHRVRHCQLLIVDDLTAKATDWEAERLTAILDARVRDQRLTVVTTNITAEQITEAWGGRFMDRLRYRLTALTFTGESRRKAPW